jgi:hypothetical protein
MGPVPKDASCNSESADTKFFFLKYWEHVDLRNIRRNKSVLRLQNFKNLTGTYLHMWQSNSRFQVGDMFHLIISSRLHCETSEKLMRTCRNPCTCSILVPVGSNLLKWVLVYVCKVCTEGFRWGNDAFLSYLSDDNIYFQFV